MIFVLFGIFHLLKVVDSFESIFFGCHVVAEEIQIFETKLTEYLAVPLLMLDSRDVLPT